MNPQVKLLWSTPDPEYQIVNASRVCRGSESKTDSKWEMVGLKKASDGSMNIEYPVMKVKLGKNDEELLRTLMKNNHNSCLRFASLAVNISNITLVCCSQLIRISNFGLLQKSLRSTIGNSCNFPEELSMDDELDRLTEDAALACHEAYNVALEKGVPKEMARYILPVSSLTEINMVSNFQGWSHFLSIRLSKRVQKETLKVAILLAKELYSLAPIIFNDPYSKALELEKSINEK